MRPLFSRKIKCLDCRSSLIAKKARSKRIYICSTYHKNPSNCNRNKVEQSYLLELLSLRFKDIEGEMELSEKVDYIEANQSIIKIYLHDDDPIISTGNFLQL